MSYDFNNPNYLYVDKATFQTWVGNHPTKIMFRFTLISNQITLTGWSPDKKRDNNDNYDQLDVLPLRISSETNNISGDTFFLGNIRLSKIDAQRIDKRAQKNPEANCILFKPVNYASDAKHIAYDVFLSRTPSSGGIISDAVVAAAKADPSPPATRK